MANKRIFYALQSVTVGGTALYGVQSVGASSTTNIESFSSFGSTNATSILQDLDLEITIENALGNGWTNGLGAMSYSNINDTILDTEVDVEIIYKTDAAAFSAVKLKSVLTGYSVTLGTDGPAIESLTFQNAGDAIFEAGVGSALSSATLNELCKVITRPDFTSFATSRYADCCEDTLDTASTQANVTSFSGSWDAGNEKISVLGQSLPYGKFASFPVETSMEVEYHVSPDVAFAASAINSGSKSGNELVNECYQVVATMPGNAYTIDRARLASKNRSGGDVGGGNVTESVSYTGYNSFAYSS